jgi:acetyl esterase/lipase
MFVGYALAQPASPFSHFAVLSPGVAIGQHWMMQPDGGLRPQPSARPVLVALGGEERTNAFNDLAGIPQSEHYADALRAATGAPVEFHELPGESHTTVFPRVVPLVLARWFGART